MRKVIRHKGTRAFFAGGDWTADFAAAEKFFDTHVVLKTQQEYKLKNVELVMVMGEIPAENDIVLPLRDVLAA